MKVNYKSICKNLNEFVARNDYRKSAALRVELTSFQPIHKAHRGRNGVGELVELQTQVIEADAIHVDQWERSTCIAVYIKSRTKGEHGFGSEGGTFLRIRDKKGKFHSLEVRPAWNSEDVKHEALARVLGETLPCEFASEEFAEFQNEQSQKVIKIVNGETTEDRLHAKRWELDQQRRQFAKKFYQDLVKYEIEDYRKERFLKFIEFAGCKLIYSFQFTDRIWGVSPEFVDVNSLGFEIGWTKRDTYNALPSTLKVTRVKEIKAVKLADLGVETSGYYTHSDYMRVLPEQVETVKRFAARFRSKRSKITDKVINQALKAS